MQKTDSLNTPYQIGVAAEAFVAGLFARMGYDVSVQYGANQPEYDLMVSKEEIILKISVKGSQDGSWGLTQSFKNSEMSYHDATASWLARHSAKTIFALAQFKDVELDNIPRVYLATPTEIKTHMDLSRNGNGDTILYEKHTWVKKNAIGYPGTEQIPNNWRISIERMEQIERKMNTKI